MTAAGAVLAGRTAAARLMVDACTVNAPDSDGVMDETTGHYTPAAGAAKYDGPCRVKPAATQDRVVEAGERPVSLRTFTVSVPVSAVEFAVDDVVRITDSALDPALIGTRLRVVDIPKGTHLTARRLVCEEQS